MATGPRAFLDAGQIASSAAAGPAVPTPMARTAGIDAGLLLIVKRCIKSVKSGAHGLDRLLHGIETLFHQLEVARWRWPETRAGRPR